MGLSRLLVIGIPLIFFLGYLLDVISEWRGKDENHQMGGD